MTGKRPTSSFYLKRLKTKGFTSPNLLGLKPRLENILKNSGGINTNDVYIIVAKVL